jgi:hypothetical protein
MISFLRTDREEHWKTFSQKRFNPPKSFDIVKENQSGDVL